VSFSSPSSVSGKRRSPRDSDGSTHPLKGACTLSVSSLSFSLSASSGLAGLPSHLCPGLYPPWLSDARLWVSFRFTWLLSTIWPIHTIDMPVLQLRLNHAVSQLVRYQLYLGGIFVNHSTGRNLLGGIFPLVTTAMFTNLGYPGASSLLGGIVSHA
jgi:hypothetical protein